MKGDFFMNNILVLEAVSWDIGTILLWLVLGGIAGWLASLVMRRDGSMGIGLNILVGIIGAVIGGVIMNLFGAPGAGGINIWSLVVAFVGAVVLLAIINLFKRGSVR